MAEFVDDTITLTIALKATSTTLPVNCENSCDLLLEYDTNNDGIIDMAELFAAAKAAERGDISMVESKFINDAYALGSINDKCPGCYTGAGQVIPTPPPPPAESEGDPTDSPHQHTLEEGEYAITVTKRNYNPVDARIEVLSDGTVSCKDVTSGTCMGSGYPRVEVVGSSVRVYMAYGGGASGVPGAVCEWIVSLGGWKAIEWADVLKIYDAYLNPGSSGVGFAVVWNDVLTTYSYYLDIPTGKPTLGNNSTNGCGFT